MSFLALNLMLGLIWMFLTGTVSIPNLLVGVIAGFVAIAALRPVLGSARYVRAVGGTLRLLVGFARELVVANLHLARDVLRPVPPFCPGFVAFDASDLPPIETVFLANLVSLTPGTLTVDADDEGKTLYIHALYADDPDRIRADVRRLANLIHAALGAEHPPKGG